MKFMCIYCVLCWTIDLFWSVCVFTTTFVWEPAMWKLPRDQTERRWIFPTHAELNWTELCRRSVRLYSQEGVVCGLTETSGMFTTSPSMTSTNYTGLTLMRIFLVVSKLFAISPGCFSSLLLVFLSVYLNGWSSASLYLFMSDCFEFVCVSLFPQTLLISLISTHYISIETSAS